MVAGQASEWTGEVHMPPTGPCTWLELHPVAVRNPKGFSSQGNERLHSDLTRRFLKEVTVLIRAAEDMSWTLVACRGV